MPDRPGGTARNAALPVVALASHQAMIGFLDIRVRSIVHVDRRRKVVKPRRSDAGASDRAVAPQRILPEAGSMLRLQRDAGNRAVVGLLQPRWSRRTDTGPAPRAADIPAAPTPGGPVLQRSPPTAAPPASATFVLPGELAFGKDITATTRGGVGNALSAAVLNLRQVKSDVDADAATALESAAKTLDGVKGEYVGIAVLSTRDVGQLNLLVTLTRPVLLDAYTGTATRLMALLDQAAPSADDQVRFEAFEDDLAEAMHAKFVKGDRSGLDIVVGAVAKISGWNKKIGEYAKKVQTWGKRLDSIKQAKDAVSAADKVKEFTDGIAKDLKPIKDVGEIARDLAVVLVLTDSGNGTAMMKGVAQFEAGIDLVDKAVGKFAGAVPVFGTWSKWYKPMVDACIKGLRKIAGLMEIKDREDIVGMWMVQEGGGTLARDANGAPVIPALYLAKQSVPGGQHVFSYLWCLREGKSPPALTDEIHDFFYKNRELVNAAAMGKSDELDYKFHLFSKNRLINFEQWLAGHWSHVWSMLYGRFGRYVPH